MANEVGIDTLSIQITASTKKASSAIDKLVGKLEDLKVQLGGINSTNFNSQLQNTAKAISAVSNASNSINSKNLKSAAAGITSMSHSMKGAEKHSLNLASAIGKVYASYWALSRGFGSIRKAIDLSSDLTEAQNVVLQSFGAQNIAKVDEWSKGLIRNFGLSELAAKTAASRFQAMGVAMGFSQNQMADMSMALVERAADIGSLYNKSFEDVAKDMNAVFTGMVAPMRKYGVDMTQASLKEWALNNGMNANIKTMTQMQKTMLRYQYVLQGTAIAQNDFLRTSDSFANQMKILKTYIQALGTVIGSTFVNLFKPVIRSMNNAMNTILGLVEKTVNAIGKLMGWQVEVSPTSVEMGDEFAQAMDETADGADGTAKGLKDADKNAKELKRTILGFDQLHVLQRDKGSDSSSDSGGSGVGDAIADALGGNGNKVNGGDMLLKPYESEIKSWFELGRKISDALSKAMEGINWKSIYEKARSFGSGLAEFLNGLITPRLFGNVGKTIAGALNTVLHFLDSFGETFDWKNFGLSIAAGINGFFNTFDFALLGSTINNWVQGIWTTISTALANIDWKSILSGLFKLLTSIDPETYAILFGAWMTKTIVSGIARILPTLITQAMVSLLAKAFGLELAKDATLSTAFLTIGRDLATTFIAGFKALLGSKAAESALAFINPLTKALTGGLSILSGAALAVKNFFDMWQNGWNILDEILKDMGIALGAVGAIILGAPAAVAGVIGLIVAAISSVAVVTHDKIAGEARNDFQAFLASTEGAGHTLEDFSRATKDAVNSVVTDLNGMDERFKHLSSVREEIGSTITKITGIATAMQVTGTATKSEVEDLMSSFSDLQTSLKDYINSYYDAIVQQMMVDMRYLESQGKLTEELKRDYATRISETYKARDAAIDSADTTMAKFEEASRKTTELADQYGWDSKEVQESTKDFIDIALEAQDVTEKYAGVQSDKLSPAIQETKDKLQALAGGLDLSQEGMQNAKDLTHAYTDTVRDMQSQVDDAKETIHGYYQNLRDNLDETTMSQEQYDWMMEQYNANEQQRISDIEDKYSELKTQLDTEMMPAFEHMNISMSDNLDEMDRNADSKLSGLFNTFRGWIDNIKNKWHELMGLSFDASANVNVNYGGVQQFANGGFIEDGLFTMNHGEIAGKFTNGQSVVANNQQITEGIRAAVVDGMMDVFMATQGSDNNEAPGDLVLVIGDEEIARASMRGQRKIDKRFNPIIQFD